MEKFHWLDRNPQLPNFVFATLRFAIRIDPDIARQALAIALRRQPLAAMEPKLTDGTWHWKPIQDRQLDGKRVFSSRSINAADGVSELHGSPDMGRDYVSYFLSVSNFSQPAALDETSGPTDSNFQPTSQTDNTSQSKVFSRIRFHSHHAASDGVASIGLINDWLTIYNNLVAGEPAENGLVDVDSSSFEKRGVLGLLIWSYLRGLPQQAIALYGATKFVFRKTKLIATESSSIKTSTFYPAVRGVWVDAARLKANRRRATEHRIGFTAWCLAKCFIAIERWNQNRAIESEAAEPADQSKSASAWRILLPISIRTAAERTAVAANRTAIVQIDRQPPAPGADLVSFCQSIDYEINFIRRWQLEKMFLIAIRLASLSNSWLTKTANNPVSRGAAVFTHLGRPFKRAMIHFNRLSESTTNTQLAQPTGLVQPTGLAQSAGLAQPIDFDLAGPIRTGTPINISFARFDHQLKLSLHYDSNIISTAEADRLLATIVDLFPADVA